MVDSIYLSPHLDDAVLSCGGQIAQRVRAGQHVQVITVFAGSPTTGLSLFAQLLHQVWRLPDDAPSARRVEDQAALGHLGAAAIHWELTDCIYRRAADGTSLYPDESSLWGTLHPADEPLVAELARRLSALPAVDVLHVPLAAGGHVDHRLLRRAAEASGRPLLHWEDYPYARDPQAVQAALAQESDWEPVSTTLDKWSLAAKIAAVAHYRSQLPTFWVNEAEMDAQIRAYALRVGAGQPAERDWRKRQPLQVTLPA